MLEKDHLARMCRARDMLRETHDPPLSVRQVAREAGISPYHFIRVFRALFGETPQQFRIRARLGRAKHLLALGDDPVTDVCFEVGFGSLGSFSALFARRIGTAPSVYRRAVRSRMSAPGVLPADMAPGCLTLMAAAFATFEKHPGALPVNASPRAARRPAPTAERGASRGSS
jgi:AraC-like DNA-binding protein